VLLVVAPVASRLSGDIGAAMAAAARVLAALYPRGRAGVGAAVDVSSHVAALSWLLFPAARRLVALDAAIGLPIDGSHACYNIYKTADDRYLALGALEPKFWEAFCGRIGRPDLVPLQYVEDVQLRILGDLCAVMR